MKKSTLSHLIGKSQHYVNIISKSRLFVDIFAMSSLNYKIPVHGWSVRVIYFQQFLVLLKRHEVEG